MSNDDLDDLMRNLVPPMIVTPDRAARVMESVLIRLDQCPQAQPQSQSWGGALLAWLAGLVPVPRYAMPMAAAALLGIVVSQGLQPAEDAAMIDHLLSATYFAGLGY
ncbi:MAG: hypothetical protein HY055_06725 [Magnetospirillum sp.]|nr:hypothetical protein [Magnetospirillum sp.]